MHNQILYILKKGCQNIKRNIWFSFVSVITISICILLSGIFYAVCLNLSGIVKEISSDITISVFLQQDVSDEQLQYIGDAIRQNEYVSTVTYISNEQAWNEYKAEYFDGIEELATGFEEDNPLENSDHYDVEILDISKQFEVVQEISKIDGVRQINQSQETADVFSDVNKSLASFSIVIIIVLFIISSFLIHSTISASISSRKAEITIMEIMGASNLFICIPFFIESLIISIIGTILPLTVFHCLYSKVMQYISIRFSSLTGLLDFVSEEMVFHMLIPASIIIGIIISLAGCTWALLKQIKYKKGER